MPNAGARARFICRSHIHGEHQGRAEHGSRSIITKAGGKQGCLDRGAAWTPEGFAEPF